MSFLSAASCFFRLVEHNLDLNKFFEEEQNALTRSIEPSRDLRLTRSIEPSRDLRLTRSIEPSRDLRSTDGASLMKSKDGRKSLRQKEHKDKIKHLEEMSKNAISCQDWERW
jgi:hypothetical protein